MYCGLFLFVLFGAARFLRGRFLWVVGVDGNRRRVVVAQHVKHNVVDERFQFVNELAYWSGMFGLYGKSINYAGGYYGIGLLSRYPILRSERVLLPNDGKTEQRSMLIADIELPSGRVLTFVCTHLEVKTSKMRQEQVRFINKYLKGVRNQILLCGDMNAEPSSEEMMMLAKDWANLTDTQLTYSTMKPQTKIDYIWSKPASKVVLLSTRVCKDVKLSDHFPVLSEIVIK